jgi:hypothetical protein
MEKGLTIKRAVIGLWLVITGFITIMN